MAYSSDFLQRQYLVSSEFPGWGGRSLNLPGSDPVLFQVKTLYIINSKSFNMLISPYLHSFP